MKMRSDCECRFESKCLDDSGLTSMAKLITDVNLERKLLDGATISPKRLGQKRERERFPNIKGPL